jgi:hypothetical protein
LKLTIKVDALCFALGRHGGERVELGGQGPGRLTALLNDLIFGANLLLYRTSPLIGLASKQMDVNPAPLMLATTVFTFSAVLIRSRFAVASIHCIRAWRFLARAVAWANPNPLLASSSGNVPNCGNGRYGAGGVAGGGTLIGVGRV